MEKSRFIIIQSAVVFGDLLETMNEGLPIIRLLAVQVLGGVFSSG
jgi:hypothetical protein